ncbi:hypothetical protein D3C87_79490 [compost metagenome]
MNRSIQSKEIEELSELLIIKTQNIPDNVKKAFTQRAVDDARKLINSGDLALDKLSYSLYRAYILGAALSDSDDLISKIEENKIMQETKPSTKNSVRKDSKIISFPKASFNL